MPRVKRKALSREEWTALRPSGEDLDTTVTARRGSVDIEGGEGLVSVSVFAQEDGVDIRIHNLQVIVKKQHVVVLQAQGGFPRSCWSVLWEGEMN